MTLKPPIGVALFLKTLPSESNKEIHTGGIHGDLTGTKEIDFFQLQTLNHFLQHTVQS